MGIELLPLADQEQIHTVMEQIGQRASADVLQLYRSTGGFIDYASDEHLWSLWSLSRICKENTATRQPRWAFSDGLIFSFVYRFQYENELVSSVWVDHGDNVTHPVASSVAELHQPLQFLSFFSRRMRHRLKLLRAALQ
jgi:hypothetical protein